MKLFSRTLRLIRINFVLAKYSIDEIVLGKHWFYPIRWIMYCNPYYWTNGKQLTRGERVRRALEDLGPIFVKLGQILSTRNDLLPDDIALELTKLQDRVPPFSGVIAKQMIEESLNASIDATFASFDVNALASASIAQVHAATLLTGENVVVKVLRPNIKKIIDRDVDLMLSVAKIAERYLSQAKHFKPQEIILEVAQTLYDELDLMREGANASQLKRNFKQSSLLYVPTIYWNYCRSNILIMERIYGIPIHDIEKLKASGINLRILAERAIEIFFTQIFRDSFFHADLHPGNLFVTAKDPLNPSFIAVDFGIVGSLNQNDQRYIAENLIAFFKRDYQRVAELHIASGWLAPDTRIDQFEGAIRSVSEPIFERPLRDISFGQLLLRLFQVARRFNINIQPQLVLLQKTLLSIEALSRTLAPDLDLWSTASPQIEKWLKKQVGAKAFLKRIRNNLPIWSEQLPDLPSMIYEVIKEKKHQQETLRFSQSIISTEKYKKNIAKIKRNYFMRGVGLSLIVVSVLLIFLNVNVNMITTFAVGGVFLLLMMYVMQ